MEMFLLRRGVRKPQEMKLWLSEIVFAFGKKFNAWTFSQAQTSLRGVSNSTTKVILVNQDYVILAKLKRKYFIEF